MDVLSGEALALAAATSHMPSSSRRSAYKHSGVNCSRRIVAMHDILYITISSTYQNSLPPGDVAAYYCELVESCISCPMLNGGDVAIIFIGQWNEHRKDGGNALFEKIQSEFILRSRSSQLVNLSVMFVNDKDAVISHRLGSVASSWWGASPTLLSSVSLLLAESDEIVQLLPVNCGKTLPMVIPKRDIADKIFDASYRLQRETYQWLERGQERLNSIEGMRERVPIWIQFCFSSSHFFDFLECCLPLHCTEICNSQLFPLRLPFDTQCRIISYIDDKDIRSLSIVSQHVRKLVDQYYLNKLSENMHRIDFILSFLLREDFDKLDCAFLNREVPTRPMGAAPRHNSFSTCGESMVLSSVSGSYSEDVLFDEFLLKDAFDCEKNLGLLRQEMILLKRETECKFCTFEKQVETFSFLNMWRCI